MSQRDLFGDDPTNTPRCQKSYYARGKARIGAFEMQCEKLSGHQGECGPAKDEVTSDSK